MFKLIKILIVLGVLLATATGGIFFWLVSSPLELKTEQVDFHIAPGSSLRMAAKEISNSGVVVDPLQLIVLAKVMRVESVIKAGSYEINRGITLLALLNKLTRGDVTQTEIAFIEGWTFRQWRERLDTHPDVRHDTKGMSDQEVMRLMGASETFSEGLFFPDTYLFAKQSRDIDVLSRAYRTMRRHLAREWETRAAGLPYTDVSQALIMASIVEKETGQDQDRPISRSKLI